MTKVAVVTGGQQGIGLGIATALVGAGYRIAILAQAPPTSAAVQNALQGLGPEAGYLQHDLQGIAATSSLVDAVEARFGPITTLVSNAGVPARLRGDMLDITPDNFDAVMNVNLRAGFFLAQEVAKRMLARPATVYRSIIFVTSVSASMVSVDRAEYCISKAGAAMMAQLFAVRLARQGIGVFDVQPGIVATDMTAGVRDTYTARIEGGLVPAARWGHPADIAAVMLPLVEGAMAFATGAVIPVDGGLSIARL